MKKLLTLAVLAVSFTLAGCVNTTPTEEAVVEPVAEEVVAPVAEETTPVAEETAPVAEETAPAAEVAPEAPAAE